MASFNDKVKIPTAVEHRSNFDLSCDHVTTMNFLQPKVVYAKEIVPTEKTNIKVETMIRLSPLNAPTFMRSKCITRGFYIPFRQVWQGWDYFITNTKTPSGTMIANAPKMKNSDLVQIIINDTTYPYVTEVTDPSARYDIKCNVATSGTANYKKYNFTKTGRLLYDSLIGLGYRFTWSFTYNDCPLQYSLLPLMCYYKAVCDWYSYNQYTSINPADALRVSLAYHNSLTSAQVKGIFNNLVRPCNYENDYFTSAFTKPDGPDTNGTSFSITSNTGSAGDVSSIAGATTLVTSTTGALNQFALNALRSLTDYCKRHQIAGSQALDRFCARWGIKMHSQLSLKSKYLGSHDANIQIGEVFNTSDSATGQPLGSYAGKGVCYGNNGVYNIESQDEFGYFVCISNIVPRVSYSQGVKRNVLRTETLDFYTPEFDSLGTQAIASGEVCVPKDRSIANNWNSDSSSNKANSVFGYTPRYADYKVQMDYLSGNFLYDSTNVGEDCYYGTRLFRDGTDDSLQSGRLVGDTFAGTSMLYADDCDQYERIFADDLTTNTAGNDHFKTIFHFDVNASLPMSPLFDNYHFENNGKTFLAQIGGSTLHN